MTRVLCAALAAAVAVACTAAGSELAAPAQEAPSARRDRPLCLPPGRGLSGYVLVHRSNIRFADHIGMRLQFRDRAGRRIYYLVGIPGGVGEGLPVVATPRLTMGAPARLLGRKDTWVVAWRDRAPCEDMAVVGNGISRSRFRGVLQAIGLLP